MAALRETLDAYFDAVESGEIDSIAHQFEQRLGR